jgi:hypothetical protein
MRDEIITVTNYEGQLITLARSAPTNTTIIVKNNNGMIETLEVLKIKNAGLLGTEPTVPRPAPDVFNY